MPDNYRKWAKDIADAIIRLKGHAALTVRRAFALGPGKPGVS